LREDGQEFSNSGEMERGGGKSFDSIEELMADLKADD
jgi:hypothetical protein